MACQMKRENVIGSQVLQLTSVSPIVNVIGDLIFRVNAQRSMTYRHFEYNKRLKRPIAIHLQQLVENSVYGWVLNRIKGSYPPFGGTKPHRPTPTLTPILLWHLFKKNLSGLKYKNGNTKSSLCSRSQAIQNKNDVDGFSYSLLMFCQQNLYIRHFYRPPFIEIIQFSDVIMSG